MHDITPEAHFGSVRYSGQHDRTTYWVRDGEVDASVANTQIVEKMLGDGRLQAGDVRAIWTTPPYADYVWAAHPNVAPAERENIRRSFLKLSVDDPSHVPLLSSLGAEAFYPASMRDFSVYQAVMAETWAATP